MNPVSLTEKYENLDSPFDLSILEEGTDYRFSPGGVTAMVYPLLRHMLSSHEIEGAVWVSLSPESPPEFIWNDLRFINIDLERDEAQDYVRFKDRIWNAIHGIEEFRFKSSEYLAFNIYSWKTADTLLRLSEEMDMFYVHDFQQLQVGNFVSPFAPAVFRWHIPCNFAGLNPHLRKFIIRNMEAYDAIIVSTKKDLEELIRTGYRGKAYQLYPHIDEDEIRNAEEGAVAEFMQRAGLPDGSHFFLVVARMDPVKSQDVAIKAIKRLSAEHPDYSLVLVGNGSFSGSSKGGLGSSKGREWRNRLEKLASDLGIREKVRFFGYADSRLLRAAYTACDAVILPSRLEGFGLVTVEAWLSGKPVIVSTGAGSSELVVDGLNGYRFSPQDDMELYDKMRELIESGRLDEMGRNGKETAKQCSLSYAAKRITEIFREASHNY
ncbi:MAG: glycosyltransferase family 4 protein [Methanomassiliicoccales archaeon]